MEYHVVLAGKCIEAKLRVMAGDGSACFLVNGLKVYAKAGEWHDKTGCPKLQDEQKPVMPNGEAAADADTAAVAGSIPAPVSAGPEQEEPEPKEPELVEETKRVDGYVKGNSRNVGKGTKKRGAYRRG